MPMISLSWSALGKSFPSCGGKRSQKLCGCTFDNWNPGCLLHYYHLCQLWKPSFLLQLRNQEISPGQVSLLDPQWFLFVLRPFLILY